MQCFPNATHQPSSKTLQELLNRTHVNQPQCVQSTEYDTKILTDTDTETFFTIPNFPKPKPRLFFRDQIFRNRNRDFYPRPNFSETETETFFPRPNFSKPKPSKIWQKSRDRDLNRDFSTSFEMKFGKIGTYKQNWNFWTKIWDFNR